MADSTVDITGPFDRPQKLLKIIDNGDSTYSIASEVMGGTLDGVTTLDNLIETRAQTPTKTQALNVQIGPGDVISSIPVVMDFAHHQLHEGETWQYTYGPAGMAQNAVLNFRIVVGNVLATKQTPHVSAEIDSTGEAWFEIFETPTTTADGTAATFYNRNRNTAGSAVTTIFTSPTVTATGTKLSGWIIGSGQKAGNATKDSIEWDLKASTVYLYRITAQGALNIAFRLIQYEDKGV